MGSVLRCEVYAFVRSALAFLSVWNFASTGYRIRFSIPFGIPIKYGTG